MTIQGAELSEWYEGLRETHPEMVPAEDEPQCARDYWTPLLLRVYGIAPWQIGRYTVKEYNALIDDLKEHGLGR